MQKNRQIKLIVALDFYEESEALSLCRKLDPHSCRLKVGKQLFTKYGPSIIEKIHSMGFEIFLDLKFHDIPVTVYKACVEAYKLGIWMLNIHLLGGREMVIAAKRARDEIRPQSKLIGVTLLTSHADKDLAYLGLKNRQQLVKELASIAADVSIDGIVCSPSDIKFIHEVSKILEFVTPGIRLDKKLNDHASVFTPKEAINIGSTYLVIGRPITEAMDPVSIIEKINLSI